MFPKQHVILGAIFSLILFLLFPKIGLFGFLIIFLSAVLMDVDHYIWHVYKKRDLSLKRAYKLHVKRANKMRSLPRKMRNKFYTGFCFLHGIELLVILFLLGFASNIFFFIFVGFAFHLILDLIDEQYHNLPLAKVSVIYDFINIRKYT